MAQDCFIHIYHKSLITELCNLQFSTQLCGLKAWVTNHNCKPEVFEFPTIWHLKLLLYYSGVFSSFMFLYSEHRFLVNVESVLSADDTPFVCSLIAKAGGARPRYTDCSHPNEGSAALLSLHVSMSFATIHSSSSPPSSLRARANLILGLLIVGAFSQAFFQFTSISSSWRAPRRRPPRKGTKFSLWGSWFKTGWQAPHPPHTLPLTLNLFFFFLLSVFDELLFPS